MLNFSGVLHLNDGAARKEFSSREGEGLIMLVGSFDAGKVCRWRHDDGLMGMPDTDCLLMVFKQFA